MTDTSTSCILYSSSRREESLNPQWVKYHFWLKYPFKSNCNLSPLVFSISRRPQFAPKLHPVVLSHSSRCSFKHFHSAPDFLFYFFSFLLCVLSPSSSHVHPGKRALCPSPLCLLSTPISSACLVFDGACSLPSPPHANAGPLGDPPTHQPAHCWQETHAGGAVPSGRRPAVNRERWGVKRQCVCACVSVHAHTNTP